MNLKINDCEILRTLEHQASAIATLAETLMWLLEERLKQVLPAPEAKVVREKIDQVWEINQESQLDNAVLGRVLDELTNRLVNQPQ